MFRQSSIELDKQLIVPCRTGNLANADQWKIAFAILVMFSLSPDNIIVSFGHYIVWLYGHIVISNLNFLELIQFIAQEIYVRGVDEESSN